MNKVNDSKRLSQALHANCVTFVYFVILYDLLIIFETQIVLDRIVASVSVSAGSRPICASIRAFALSIQ